MKTQNQAGHDLLKKIIFLNNITRGYIHKRSCRINIYLTFALRITHIWE